LISTKTFKVAIKFGGVRSGLSHFAACLFGDPRFFRPASSLDFRKFALNPSPNLEDFIQTLLPDANPEHVRKALDTSRVGIDNLLRENNSDLSFPERWNSGRNLQYLLSTMVILIKPTVVVETGSANGSSAAAICFALEQNQIGHLWSFDIEPEVGQLVPKSLRSKVSFVCVSGTVKDIKERLQTLDFKSSPSIFLHDADHSYLGQLTDYSLAREMGFDYIVSDDVDASLAFCDFARSNGQIFYDAPKFIGAVKMVSE
jgi:hypothetical protein